MARDEGFGDVVNAGEVTALPEHAHAVHIDVGGLDAATTYYYRFSYGRYTSPWGRTRTLPDGAPDAFSLAVVNCQQFESGTYAAYRHLVEEDVDLVLHLGDYIYEVPGGAGSRIPGRASLPSHEVETLADYRVRYASYKQDPDLLGAHASHPFACTWDDHEVVDDYTGSVAPGEGAAAFAARRRAAYQAWWEHTPVRLDPPTGDGLRVHRTFRIGDLARLTLLDERQHADEPPCRGRTGATLDVGDCPDRHTNTGSRLGRAQEVWLRDVLDRGDVRWNLLGNPVVLAGVDVGRRGDAYYLDTWDGYPRARARLIEHLGRIDDVVVLTGDYHAGMVLDVLATPFDADSEVVATEFLAPPISSPLFAADASQRTPQLREQLNGHGYLRVDVTPDEVTARFRILDDVANLWSRIETASTWTVATGVAAATRGPKRPTS